MIFENATNTTIWLDDAVVPIRPGERFYVSEKWLGRSAQALNTSGSGIEASVQSMISMGWIREIKAHQKDGKGWDQIADKGISKSYGDKEMIVEDEETLVPMVPTYIPKGEWDEYPTAFYTKKKVQKKVQKKRKKRVVTRKIGRAHV